MRCVHGNTCSYRHNFHVGSGTTATIYVPDDYPTTQGATHAVEIGNKFIVRTGTYVENVDYLGKAIRVEIGQGASVRTIGRWAWRECSDVPEWRRGRNGTGRILTSQKSGK